MKGQISGGLKVVLAIYALLWAIYGLLHVISPALMQATDPAIERVLGAAIVVLAIGAWWAYLDKAWDHVRIMILLQVGWMILYTITMVWGILSGGITSAAWPPAIIGAVFAVLLAVLYGREAGIQSR